MLPAVDRYPFSAVVRCPLRHTLQHRSYAPTPGTCWCDGWSLLFLPRSVFPQLVAGGGRGHLQGRRGGGDRRASAGAGSPMRPLWAGVDAGAQQLPPPPGGSTGRRAADGGAPAGAPVLLRSRRLQRRHVRRAGPGSDRAACAAHRRLAGCFGGHRARAGRAGRIEIGDRAGHAGQPVDATAPDPQVARSARRGGDGPWRRRIRLATRT